MISPETVVQPPDFDQFPWAPGFRPTVDAGFPAYPIIYRDKVPAGNGVLVTLDGATYLVTSPSVVGTSPSSLIDATFNGPGGWSINNLPQPWFVRHPSLPGLVGIRLTGQEAGALARAGVSPWPLSPDPNLPLGSVARSLSREVPGSLDLRTWLAFLSGRESNQWISLLAGAVGGDGLAGPTIDSSGRLVGIASRSESDGCWTEQTLVTGPEIAGLLRRDLVIDGWGIPYWLDRDRYLELLRYLASKGYTVVNEAGRCSMRGGRGGFSCRCDGEGFPMTAIAAISARPSDDLSLATDGGVGGDVPGAGFAVLELPPSDGRAVEVRGKDPASAAEVFYLHVIPDGVPPPPPVPPKPVVVVEPEKPRPTPPPEAPVTPVRPVDPPVRPKPPEPPVVPPPTLRISRDWTGPTWSEDGSQCTILIAVPLDETFTDEVRSKMMLESIEVNAPGLGSRRAAVIAPSGSPDVRLPVRQGRVWILMKNPPGTPMDEEPSSASLRSELDPPDCCGLSGESRRVRVDGEEFDLWEVVMGDLSRKATFSINGGSLRETSESSCELRPLQIESLQVR